MTFTILLLDMKESQMFEPLHGNNLTIWISFEKVKHNWYHKELLTCWVTLNSTNLLSSHTGWPNAPERTKAKPFLQLPPDLHCLTAQISSFPHKPAWFRIPRYPATWLQIPQQTGVWLKASKHEMRKSKAHRHGRQAECMPIMFIVTSEYGHREFVNTYTQQASEWQEPFLLQMFVSHIPNKIYS